MNRRIERARRLRRSIFAGIALLALAFAAAKWSAHVSAQSLPQAVETIGKARVATRILFTTAHPDDEQAGLLAYLARGVHADVALLTITRGQGGQNAIGPEQNGELGTIRTTELLAADSHYGVHQFFTRAVDTGFSKSPDRTMKIWGPTLPMEDMVRAIRTYRPQIVINGWGGVKNGHGQHQASGILTPQAVAAAADPTKFPDQIAEGLPAWKVPLSVRPVGFGPPGAGGRGAPAPPPAGSIELPANSISSLWGESYNELGAEGHEEHRSQGTPTLFGNAFFRRPAVLIPEDPNIKLDAGQFSQSITSLADRFPSFQALMTPALASADDSLAAAEKSMLQLDRAAAANSVAQAGKQIAALRDEIVKQNAPDKDSALWEIDGVRGRIDAALAEVVAVSIAVNADRHELVAGESLGIDLGFPDKPAVPVEWAVDAATIQTPADWTTTFAETKPGSGAYHFSIAIPAGATAPTSSADAILPFPAPLARLALRVTVDGYTFAIEKPVEFSEAKTIGIETYPLELVPPVTLTVEPEQVMVPVKHAGAPVELLARVRYHATKPANVSVGLDAPDGWSVQPVMSLDFSAPGDRLIRFVATPPARTAIGAYPLRPFAKIGAETFRASLEPIPTLPTRNSSHPADATVHVLDLNVPPTLRVGYIDADNDLVPETLRRIGIQVDLLDEVALAFGDLSRYDAIVVGLRAYELRPDVMSSNGRLLDYVQKGGTLLVQYQRDFAWNKLKPAPFKAEIANGGTRVTDAGSPVRLLAPNDPLLNVPNKISLADFEGWVQERGIYFWEDKPDKLDPKYVTLLGFTDQGEPEAKGSLVYARYGKGLYIYTGLVFFRELPAGVPGAYRLFVNLISQTRRPISK
jgi:LmbE family N-acetylglucosaminyl deacetylase